MADYVVVLTVDDSIVESDDSIEVACREANDALNIGTPRWSPVPMTVRPLSEVIAC